MPTATKKCRNCKTRGRNEEMLFLFGVYYCDDKCASDYSRQSKQQAKGKRMIEKAQRGEKKAHKNEDMPHQLTLTRLSFNKMIRLLDRGNRCPTCREPLIDGQYDAGHVRTVASCPQLRFDARNCFGQCRPCNGSGTIRRKTRKTQEVVSELYKEWILEAKGQDYYDWLYGPHESPEWNYDKLKAIRKECDAESRRLEQGLPPSRDWRVPT